MKPTSLLRTDMPKTFGKQATLPRLPVPALSESLDRYLKSLEPILQQKEDFGELPSGATAASELAQRRQWADDLLAGVGPLLNERLYDVDQTTDNNWFDDRFWLQKAYHEWRAPLLINSNWWLMFRPDEDTPKEVANYLGDAPAYSPEAITKQNWHQSKWGLRRATWLTYRMALYKLALDKETIKPDASRAGAFCMHQYSRVFGVTRIPSRPHDWNTASRPESAKHITVMANDNLYEVPVFNEHGEIVPLPELEKTLAAIIEDASTGRGEALGLLTAEQRDTWSLAREHLLTLAPQNRKSLDSVQSSLFVLSLDSNVLGLPQGHPSAEVGCEPAVADAHAISTSGGGRFGHNRWFDKSLCLNVEPNGRAGFLGEHSPVDALIPSIIGEYLVSVPSPKPEESFPQDLEGVSLLDAPVTFQKLAFVTDDKTRAAITTAEENAKAIVSESDIGVLWYDEYGADWIKKVARQAPDAYLQMVLQVAYASVHGRQTATYETASTRLFKHGRTDVIRSFSNDAYALVKGIRENKAPEELYKLLTAATTAHSRQTRDHSFGKGFDRHMAGLRLVFRPEDDGEFPALFTDPLFTESQSWKLSTSGLSAGDRFVGTGFGSGFPDGFGVNYLAGGKVLKFGLESKRTNPKGDGHPIGMYKRNIVDALRKLRSIVEQGRPADEPEKAKL
ncbi:carnitine O-acetyltransferase [Malassezia japonica]|uniref:Carnitine O-acetyltransferase n=1 Tax=Malassezia japonica TaxID=223818 RepID=A0AAF0J9V6_9BASI|nr:carnitine O-acetyltransferase [Malassezia japonica]WFD37994.1 carnitine O-acetyltransferase [Malassezia japonica]